jgi:cobalamin-dependent methionine synthase I
LVLPVLDRSSERLRIGTAATDAVFEGEVARFLGDSQLVLVFIATAGGRVEQLASQLMADDEALPAMIVGAVGSERAEAAQSAVIEGVRTRIESVGLAPTLPYSPGYCGMELTEQSQLFELFHGQTAGVSLSPTCQMLPIKSVSGLVGLAPPETVGPERSPCERCQLENCHMRRVEASGT